MSEGVCVIGNLNADLLLYPLVDFPAWGTEVVARSMDWRPGGIGNALLCLAALGVGVSAVANVGRDALGREILSTLEGAGVDVSYVERCAGVRTGVSVGIGREDGERSFVTHLGHLDLLDIDRILRQRAAWREAQCVLISGYFLLPGLGFGGTKMLVDHLRLDGKTVLFDIGWDVAGWSERTREEVLRLVGAVDVFLPSLNEARVLTGERAPERCLEKLWRRSRRSKCVIIKMGQAGSVARTGEGALGQPAFPVSPLDTTGAGDCFNAGIAFGLLKNWDVPQTLRFANALAAIVISRPREVGCPTFDEVQEFAGLWRAR